MHHSSSHSPSDFRQTGKLLGDANRRDIRLSNPLEYLALFGGSGSRGTVPNVMSGEAGPINEVIVSGVMRLQFQDTPASPLLLTLMIATDSIYKAAIRRLVETNKRLAVALCRNIKTAMPWRLGRISLQSWYHCAIVFLPNVWMRRYWSDAS
jgi:hypothetical protein